METLKPLLKDAEAEDVNVHLYRSMIGSLMYLTSLRTDIMFLKCACARFQDTPKVSYLHDVKRIFRYLKGQPKLGLWYPKDSPFDLEAYTDSDNAGASLDKKSTIGGCKFLGSRLISWQYKKQIMVASTTEAEYVAAASCFGQGKDFSGKVTPLFETMMVQPQEDMGEDLEILTDSHHTPTERMIKDLDADEGVALVDETQGRNDQDMFDTSIFNDEEVVAE
nr:uncharacterized mitochondrial protein AtMg00810-like [Tanacetum cinerariifolium]